MITRSCSLMPVFKKASMSMSLSVSQKSNGQAKNLQVAIVSMFFHMFTLIVMSLYMDMTSSESALPDIL